MTRQLQLKTPAQRAAHRQQLAERKAFEERENDKIVRRVLQTATGLTEQDFDVVLIPSGYADTSALPDERIRKYAEHLRKVVSQAHDRTDESDTQAYNLKMRRLHEQFETRFAAEPGLRDISDRICGICEGGCCTTGNNFAYINSATIKRMKERQPGLSDDDLVQAYLSRLSSQTITNACINQTASGCVLPVEMRSDTCNGFYCDALSAWHNRPREARANQVLAIKRSGAFSKQNDLTQSRKVVRVTLVKQKRPRL